MTNEKEKKISSLLKDFSIRTSLYYFNQFFLSPNSTTLSLFNNDNIKKYIIWRGRSHLLNIE